MKESPQHPGKVVKCTRQNYVVEIQGKQVKCTVRGKIAGVSGEARTSVKVGDDVQVRLVAGGQAGIIEKIFPWRSKFSRSVEGKAYREHIMAVNIDQIVLIMSAREPAFKSGLLDRYLVIAEKNALRPVICLNKMDLAEPGEFDDYARWYSKLGYSFVFTSAFTGQGVDQLAAMLTEKVSVLAGHSGVGKSSLIKRIDPGLDLKIESISSKTRKGRHATTHVQLFPISPGGYVIDTPGIRELGLWNVYQDQLKNYFAEFREFAPDCQFNNCQHLQEPSCAVKHAVEEGLIFEKRYRNYCNILKDLRAAAHEPIRFR